MAYFVTYALLEMVRAVEGAERQRAIRAGPPFGAQTLPLDARPVAWALVRTGENGESCVEALAIATLLEHDTHHACKQQNSNEISIGRYL